MIYRMTEWGYEGYDVTGAQRLAGVGAPLKQWHPQVVEQQPCTRCKAGRFVEGDENVPKEWNKEMCPPCAIQDFAERMEAERIKKEKVAKEAAAKKT